MTDRARWTQADVVRRWIVAAAVAVTALVVALLLDDWLRDFMLDHRDSGVHRAAGVLGRLGATEVVTPIALLGGTLLAAARREPRPLLVVVCAQFLTVTTVGLLKNLLERPEPLDALGDLGRSFPSGHAAQATAVYLSLAWLLGEVSTPAVRRAARAAAVVLVAVVIASLLVRNSHWLSDFVGGVAIGGAAASVARLVLTPGRVLATTDLVRTRWLGSAARSRRP